MSQTKVTPVASNLAKDFAIWTSFVIRSPLKKTKGTLIDQILRSNIPVRSETPKVVPAEPSPIAQRTAFMVLALETCPNELTYVCRTLQRVSLVLP